MTKIETPTTNASDLAILVLQHRGSVLNWDPDLGFYRPHADTRLYDQVVMVEQFFSDKEIDRDIRRFAQRVTCKGQPLKVSGALLSEVRDWMKHLIIALFHDPNHLIFTDDDGAQLTIHEWMRKTNAETPAGN